MSRSTVGLALIIAAALAGCQKEDEVPAPLRPVLTLTISPITTETFGPFASSVEARYETDLGFQISGRMISRDVFVGDRVKKGQRFAALDPTLPQFAFARSSADVTDAKAQLLNAQGIAERQKILAGGGNVSQATMDNATAGLATAKARLDQNEAALRVAKDQIGYTELHAIYDGVITAWSAEVGQYVNSGQNVVKIARPDVLEAVVDIPDNLMVGVKADMEFTVYVQASPKITAKARVREIGPLADSVTRTHRVRLTLQAPTDAFRIGTTITAAVRRDIPPKILVPATAVVGDAKSKFVWVLAKDGGSVTRRTVSVIQADNNQVVVSSGLEAGDKIVVVGVHSLRDGDAVAGEAGNETKVESTRL